MSFNKTKEAHEKLMSERKEVPLNSKYQEGLSNFSNLIFVSGLSEYAREKMQQSLNDLKELVDKETPIKYIEIYDEELSTTRNCCKKCEFEVDDIYCSNCGQKQDWSDEE